MFQSLDISSISNGELNLEGGDLKTSTATESLLNTVNFCLLTSLRGYKPKQDFGASPERFIGKPNNRTNRDYMRIHVGHHLRNQGVLVSGDYNLQVISVSNNEVAVIMKINVSILESDPDAVPEETIIAYRYDFNNGTLEKVR
jgi:hypothetical protein